MGNEQSSPNPRRGQNKLSKPRTNSSGNALNTGTPNGTPGRDNPQSNDSSRKSRYSLFTNDSQGEYGEDGKEKRPKRRGIFRSKSSQARTRAALDVAPEIVIQNSEPEPVETPVRRYSVVNHNGPAHSTPDLTMQRYVHSAHIGIILSATLQTTIPCSSFPSTSSHFKPTVSTVTGGRTKLPSARKRRDS
jgi:hypothetical protein